MKSAPPRLSRTLQAVFLFPSPLKTETALNGTGFRRFLSRPLAAPGENRPPLTRCRQIHHNRDMEHLRNLLAGMGRVLMLAPERDYVRPERGFARDAGALRGDARRVGADLRRAIARHGQQNRACS